MLLVYYIIISYYIYIYILYQKQHRPQQKHYKVQANYDAAKTGMALVAGEALTGLSDMQH